MSLAACRGGRPLPELPSPDLAGATAPVREAIAAAGETARAHPMDAAAVARFGMVLHAHQQLAAAAQTYARAVALAPDQPDYLYYQGTVLMAQGLYADAAPPLRAALALRESVPGRLRLAEALYAGGKPDEARREYEALLRADPALAAAQYGLGRCLQGEEAAAALRRAVELFPRYGAARFALAAVYRQMGKSAEAEAQLFDYERDKLIVPPVADPAMAAVQALDRSAGGLMRTAQMLEREGRLAEAADLQERALAADPKMTQAWVNLISLYARLGALEKAERAYREAIRLEPKNGAAHYNYGVLCVQQERIAEAGKAFEAAVATDPNHAEALDSLGAVVETTGALEKAAGLYRRALALRPGLRLAHYHLGRILVNQQRAAEAVGHFEKAAEGPADTQTASYLYAWGATLARMHARERAIPVLRRARAEAERMGQAELAASISRDLRALGSPD